MSSLQTDNSTPWKPVRLWPGVLAAVLLLLVRFVVPIVVPDAMPLGILGALVGALAILVWWLFFSLARWWERLGAVAVMVVAVVATRLMLHPSIAGGMMGFMFFVFAIPPLTAAFVAAVAVSRRLPDALRRGAIVATIFLACGAWGLVRTGGISGSGGSDFHWRWTQSPEERLLAGTRDEPLAVQPSPPPTDIREKLTPADATNPPAAAPSSPTAKIPDHRVVTRVDEPKSALPPAPVPARRSTGWPGFRGPQRDAVVRAVRIVTDWSQSPPVLIWRRPVGPGWSSFAVDGNAVYTQEQRGDEEIVSSYNLATGAPVWRHRDAARFWESNAGAGPRATPTFSNGRIYTLGATGILNAIDAHNGAIVWSRNAASDTGAKIPDWGFAGSPLVINDNVIVAASGRLAAYDIATGNPRWSRQSGGSGYSSPQFATIDGVAQILLLNTSGVIGVASEDGTPLWNHQWKGDGIVQPMMIAGGDVLIGSGSGMGEVGMRRLSISHDASGWTVKERWTSNGLKPYFNDFVVHNGHAYGFDGNILSCIDLTDGARKWKGGRYGSGQLMLLAEADVLLVLSEEGELALVKATPDKFTEVGRFKAIEGKTWNHHVLVGDVLLVRNGEEMAAFRLSLLEH